MLIGAAMLMERLVYFGWLDGLSGWWSNLVNSMALLVVLQMLGVTLLGRNDDLLKKRRKSRLYLVLVIVIASLSTLVLGAVLYQEYQATINVFNLTPAVIALSVWLMKIEPNTFEFVDNLQPETVSLSARDHALKIKLDEVIDQDQCYSEPNLSIGSLASRLAVNLPIG